MGYCNFIDGTCKSCHNDYMGPKCEMGKVFDRFQENVLNISTLLTAPTPFFKNPPKIKKIGYTNAEILVDNFELERFSPTDSSRYGYTVQYKVLIKIDKICMIQECILGNKLFRMDSS